MATRSATRASPPAAGGRCAAADEGRAGEAQLGLDLDYTQVTKAGCATLAAAFDSGALPALKRLHLLGIPASAAAKAAVNATRANLNYLRSTPSYKL